MAEGLFLGIALLSDSYTPIRKAVHLGCLRTDPVFGIIKSALGFRQFSMRGLEKARDEWSLVTMAWNIKRMFVLKSA